MVSKSDISFLMLRKPHKSSSLSTSTFYVGKPLFVFVFLMNKIQTSPSFSKDIFSWATFYIFLFKYESLYSCLLHLFIVHFLKQIFYIVSIIFRTFLFSFAKNKYDINQNGIVYILKSRGFSFRDFIFPI